MTIYPHITNPVCLAAYRAERAQLANTPGSSLTPAQLARLAYLNALLRHSRKFTDSQGKLIPQS